MSMSHRGYSGSVEYDSRDRIFHGQVTGITDVVTFQGTSVEELEASFRSSVDIYLDLCTKNGLEPQRPYSGRFVIRLSPGMHREASIAARTARSSMNNWITGAIQARLDAENARAASAGVEERLSDAAGG
jgi:predicted HicB family RNase H-like nuclease